MDFFSSQESLTAVEWSLRAIVSFFFLVFVAKIMGQRSISKLRFLDFVILLLLGNILAHPLSDEGLGLKGSMISISVLVILYLAGIFLSLKSNRIRTFFNPSPMPLIENGQILYKNLYKAKITIEFLLSELRKEKTDDIQKVALALWEPGGTISIFLAPQYQPVTTADLNLPIKPFDFPKTVVKERTIDNNELQQLGKDEQWLKDRIKETYDVTVNEVLLATLDKGNNLKVFLYH